MTQTGILSEGARRVWRYQRVLWWMFLVNFILASCSALPLSARLARVLGNRLGMQELGSRFNVAAFLELSSNPDAAFWAGSTGSMLWALMFLLFVLFLTGGILEAYRTPRKLRTGEFFQSCGTFFWRWVRLLLLFVIVLLPVLILAYKISDWSLSLSDESPQEKLGFWVQMVGLVIVLFLMMAVRLWFDMAQVRAVANEERVMWRTLFRAFRQTFGNFGSLFWMYFRISFLAWVSLAVALWLWVKIPGGRFGLSSLLLELVLLWWIGTRLWQRASETVWFERHQEVVPAPLPAPEPEPEPPVPTAAPAL